MKQKTHSGTKKRAKKTGSGKIRMEKSCKRHLLAQKSKRQKSMGGDKQCVSKTNEKKLKALLS
ncbi:50S ribosomal protein L35 [Candidatus Peregrinibacteria bacterium CG22_combo_CG10-13_8_21_14_all_44_10]|nr:MAG: hypothetical protein AUK45_02705 [Candidatus Peregrinibacteria bacterium CG2_30_44_17]PIP65992.1 MAG: 50S ribosomal protein L35 [Candidatus Peregrinibacteria bacterium CG22_combo_CG10-13_8_21_14_all_44_10]PIS03874.1 MAG: 50S ribosomal protein L35 [Candidatus Peregrinibacteria bacterium CG10_big_fil_rev_8_21_14_0_10_44_7]PIX79848.1 MAG: 50S ribosomal protein L35 [Candidatus Peregrinibacteria bacterium CG_4_10_14_3_um_filter_44_21]PJB89315.1 MAG: 50S ribosomal protein L35 [Candidatus Pere